MSDASELIREAIKDLPDTPKAPARQSPLGHYKLEGKTAVPVDDILEWSRALSEQDRRVGRDEIAPGIIVSTVFLGIDHNFWNDGPAILFETMIFNDYGDTDVYHRYSTWEQAEIGHQIIVAYEKGKLGLLS